MSRYLHRAMIRQTQTRCIIHYTLCIAAEDFSVHGLLGWPSDQNAVETAPWIFAGDDASTNGCVMGPHFLPVLLCSMAV